MTLILAIGVLGAVGAVIRAALTAASPALVGTFVVNVLASLALGIVHGRAGVAAEAVAVGLLGAASTWSTVAGEVRSLHQDDRSTIAAAYVAGTLVAGVGAAWLGLQLG